MIIDRAKSRTLLANEYYEKHHIIPRSLGGTDKKENLVSLTAKEHYMCHLLLVKMLEGEFKYKMLCALMRMSRSNQPQRIIIKSKIYEKIKKEKSLLHSLLYRGKNNPFYGKNHSEGTKQRLREARAKQVERQGSTMTKEAREKLSVAAKGRSLSKNHREKIGIANKGKIRSEEFKKAVAKRMSGHIKSKETLEKLKIKASKSPKPQITCPHCGKTGGEPSMKRWHFENCRNKY